MIRGKILLIDDNENDLMLTKEFLEKAGYKVIHNNGWLGTINNIKYSEPDIVLLDVKMPALSGDMLYDLINKQVKSKKIPIIFYSSLDEGSLRKLKFKKGATDFISKGDIFQLYKKISLYLKKSKNAE